MSFPRRQATTLTLPTEDSEAPPTTAADDSEIPPGSSVAHLYFDSVFPLTLGSFDPRAYLSAVNAASSLESLKKAIPESQSIGYDFQVLGVESRAKDGGAFVTFAYKPDSSAPTQSKAVLRRIPSNSSLSSEEASTLTLINSRIRPHLKPIHQYTLSPTRLLPLSWLSPPRAHIVLGTPWLEDLSRYPSRTIRMSFLEGNTAPTEQQVWEMLRPYGRVSSLEVDSKANQATAVYYRMRGATSARNCLYGASIGGRKVLIDYLPPLHSHKIWNWISTHPRIVFPIMAFFLGSITYAVFDPIRGWFVKNNVENTFDLDAYPLYAWLHRKTSRLFGHTGSKSNSIQDDWWERQAAVDEIQSWLREPPSTFITISGPRGSGKHHLLEGAVKDGSVKHLTINCEEIARITKNEEAALVPAVAKEVGYFPVFNWINSLNSLIDLASVGLIGSKAGFSTPTDAQLKQVLTVTSAALASIKEGILKDKEKAAKKGKLKRTAAGAQEQSNTVDQLAKAAVATREIKKSFKDTTEETSAKERRDTRDELGPEAELLAAPVNEGEDRGCDVPVVIIDGFQHKGVKSEMLWTVLGDWAAELTTSKVAHVVFVSDNPVAMGKTLSRSLPNIPFQTIVLADADEDRARGYVFAKLKEMGKVEEHSRSKTFSPSNNQTSIASLFSRGDQTQPEGKEEENFAKEMDSETAKWVDLLGGRLTDLENLVQKVSLGQSVENAVKDIIARTVVEIRKNTFGDDMEDAKSLPWTRGQAWIVVEQLAKYGELPYYAILHDNFKSDESALKALEQAEIISVRHIDSRPSTIRAGRPVIQEALQSLVADSVFSDTQRLLSNASSIDSCEKVIREVEAEIHQLGEGINSGANLLKGSSSQAAKERFDYLLEKMAANQDKIRVLERKNEALKQNLVRKE